MSIKLRIVNNNLVVVHETVRNVISVFFEMVLNMIHLWLQEFPKVNTVAKDLDVISCCLLPERKSEEAHKPFQQTSCVKSKLNVIPGIPGNGGL